ncbi:activating signal cointegrator 1 complex subunit 2 homolog isoform X6 [Cydia pomonella]|uniref:activating signal cointegrator 1 complex subunit 2 homolog isoform X6 n=1 Tax=Cydia pomonella TaxID=82600 RepID=UPI002ADD3F28|nr:activating signal cointegrator 1 complex subunit 2 homolog isoform X6 [Cydia pomonella]
MATGPKIVHKQFNSPIGLYSQKNIQETLNKHLSNLDNGGVGIDFNNPSTDKPGNLAHSAVLRMLEEEERGRRNPGQKKVVWPPVPETNGYHQPQHQQQSPAYHAQHSPSAPQSHPQQYQTPPKPQYHNSPLYNEQYQQQPQYQQQQPQYQQQHSPQQNQPAYCDGRRQEPTGLSKLIPFGPGVSASAAPAYRQGPPSPAPAPYKQPNSRWAPVPAPLSPQTYPSQQQPQYSPQQQYSQPQQQYSQPQQQYQQQQYSQPEYAPPQYSPPEYPPQYEYQSPQRQFEPPPTTITLRQQPPVHQKPPPVFPSQPATASFQGGVNMRGDQKWPPQSVREAVAAENEARLQLAKGPACRPRKVKKDYTGFFAQHALNQSYPGYRAPPGTQHYEDHSGRSSY